MTNDDGSAPRATRGGAPTARLDERGRDDAEQDLRATADSIRLDLARLAELESEKQTLDLADPRVDQMSDEAVALADRIQRETRIERELSRDLS